jgi:predicted Zn-dependent peptidase
MYLGTRPDNLKEALSVVTGELARCVEDPTDEQELIRSRENLKGRIVLALESTGARMSRLGASILNEMPIMEIDEVIDRIDAVGISDVREIAAELFVAERLSVVGVGPDEDLFREAIGPLGGSSEQAPGGEGSAGESLLSGGSAR